jgi:hypothetical protein
MIMPSLHARERDVDFSPRGLLCLLHKGADHNEPLPICREIDGARNTVPPSHPYFPEPPLQMVNMRLRHFLRTKVFEHLCNTQEVGIHVSREALQLCFSLVSNIYVPAHKLLYLF